MIRDQIMQLAQSDPKFAQAVDVMEQQVARMPIVPEDLDDAIAMLEFVLQNPDKYLEVRAAAIKDGVIAPNMVPEQFDQVFIVSLLVALYGLQDRLGQRGFSRGGLSVAARRLQTGGRGGDSELVHVNRREAEMLRRMGGAGTINPNTGLREYKGGLGKILGAIAPIALTFIAPGLGTAIGTALGATGTMASVVGGAIVGGATSALTGGDPLRGAVMGGIGGWAGAPSADAAAGTTAATTGGGAIAPGTASVTTGGSTGLQAPDSFGRFASEGATQAATGASTAGQAGLQAPSSFGKFASAAASPSDAVIQSMQDANAQAPSYSGKADFSVDAVPGTAVPTSIRLPDGTYAPAPGTAGVTQQGVPGTYQFNPKTGIPELVPQAGSFKVVDGQSTFVPQEPSFLQKLAGSTGAQPGKGGLSFGNVLSAASALNALSGAPPQVKNSIGKLSPAEQEIFTRPGFSWDWNRLQGDAAANNMDVAEYIANNWNKITSGAYNIQNAPVAQAKARGGALTALANYVQGGGTGRSDEIDAKLSDGEYVMDAETVAMLGDGSNKAGAQKLDAMRRAIRAHKGKALAKGKFSPNAKSPLAYLKEVA